MPCWLSKEVDKVNYIKQLNAFYEWLQSNQLSTSALALYFALLMVNNKCGWQEWFSRSSQYLCQMINASKNTFKRAREELKQKRLIEYEISNKKNEHTKYKIIPLYENSEQTLGSNIDTKQTLGSISDPQSDPQSDPETDPIYKLETKTKTKTNKDINIINMSFIDEVETEKETIPYQKIVDLYHEYCPSLSRVIKLTDQRKRHIKRAWKEFKGDINKFIEVFKKAEESDFLSGRSGAWKGCGFDWLIIYNNMIKVLEGKYDNKEAVNNKTKDRSKRWEEDEFREFYE